MGKAAPDPILLLHLPTLSPLPPLQNSLCAGEEQGLLGFLFPVGSFVIESPAVLRFICLPPERQWGRQAGAARGGWLPELPVIHGLCI